MGPGNQIVVPRSEPCADNLGFGAQRTVTLADGTPAVSIAVVAALHSNELAPGLVTESLRTLLNENFLSAYGGLAIGYVLTFSNGLKAYLAEIREPLAIFACFGSHKVFMLDAESEALHGVATKWLNERVTKLECPHLGRSRSSSFILERKK
jgi:hypothetical protein